MHADRSFWQNEAKKLCNFSQGCMARLVVRTAMQPQQRRKAITFALDRTAHELDVLARYERRAFFPP